MSEGGGHEHKQHGSCAADYLLTAATATGRGQSENRNINGFILRDGNGKLQFGLEKGAEYNRELELSGQSGILESRRRYIISTFALKHKIDWAIVLVFTGNVITMFYQKCKLK